MVILEEGRIVEAGATREILADPQHQYTRKLLGSVPRMPALDSRTTPMTTTADYLARARSLEGEAPQQPEGAERLAQHHRPLCARPCSACRVETAEDNDIVLSAGPAHLGTVTQEPDGKVTFKPTDGEAIHHAEQEAPAEVSVGQPAVRDHHGER